MKNTTHTQTSENANWQQQAQLRLKEGGLLLLVVLCIYLWMVLLTFDVNDSSFTNSTGQIDTVNNAGGQIGAWISDVLFSVLGYFAWIFPLVLMLKTVLVFQNRYLAVIWNGWLFALRATGFILLLCSGAALAHVHFPIPENAPKNFNILGSSLGEALINVLNVEGATLLLLASFLFGLTAYANLSWFKIMDGIGNITIRTSARVKTWLQDTLGEVKEHKQEKLQLREKEAQLSVSKRVSEPAIVMSAEPAENEMERARKGRREPVIAAPSAPRAAAAESQPVSKVKHKPAVTSSTVVGTLPDFSLLDKAEKKKPSYSEETLQSLSRLLEIKLKEFGVTVEVESVHPGPVVTRFEVQLAPGVKVSRITNLAKDLARSMAMISVRVVEVIPGKTTVGIEVPNEDRQIVRFSEVIEGWGERDDFVGVV